MLFTVTPQIAPLDISTLAFVAICLSALLGVMLIFAWMQQRNVRALAWWGSAYLIGASSIALWAAPQPLVEFPTLWPQAMTFVACGMFWNGVRLFHGRRLLPAAAFAGAILWLGLCQLPIFAEGSHEKIALGVVVVATYTFFIALELHRERRKSLYSRKAAILVPVMHAAIFLSPLAMQLLLPAAYAASWLTVFMLEIMLYAVGSAFIVLLMVKDKDVTIYRSAASTDPLTGLLNRRAFLENAHLLCARQAERRQPVTLLMLDLDHFKSINDRFGHATGDETLRVFANVARANMRASDLVGRLGGEEFAVMVPEPEELSVRIAERLRTAFASAGVTIGQQVIGATASIGVATAHEPVTDISALIGRADAALYRAKHEGRNRVCRAGDAAAAATAATVPAQPGTLAAVGGKKARPRRARPAGLTLGVTGATSRLPSAR